MSRKKLFPGCMLHAAQKNCLAFARKTTQRHCGHNLSQFCDSFFHAVHEKWAEKSKKTERERPQPNLANLSSKPNEERPSTAAKALKECDEDMYPNLYVLLKICCTIPATSCECERSASALRRLHTFNRASMTQERLSSLALMHIHYLTDIDLDIVVDLFAKMHPRRLELGTLLKDRDDQQPAE